MRFALSLSLIALSSAPALAQSEAQEALDHAASLYREERFAEAAEAFERAAALDPGSLELWTSMGWAYRKAGEPQKAREVWTRVLKVDPERASLWNQVAAIDIDREEWDAAAESLRRSVSLEPDESHVRSRLAMTLESAGRVEE
ncbi:MAG TPA: tetratricopeptide repeat protein, partial [Vicinamibacteria bacterium]|nr:tetratricopeptide repeat protein [Vicinamibacteria bacterium]